MKRLVFVLAALPLFAAACAPGAASTPPAPPTSTIPAPAPGIVLKWHREGGIAGFCDDLTVSASGGATPASCAMQSPYPAGTLTADELKQLEAWRQAYGTVLVEQKDPPVPDAMAVTLVLYGQGSGQPTDADRQAMMVWAQTVYDRLAP